ncbi:hypothetical protein E2C01_073639 [Portunus trituberculatus]|uniref:Uncharacterized protein n=1 Tax=Portunus trituberculatus TaxID=210409 RepID=A0A5B7IB48_PORTR|nr:hypothetical protein [Portunus trituberculatus]
MQRFIITPSVIPSRAKKWCPMRQGGAASSLGPGTTTAAATRQPASPRPRRHHECSYSHHPGSFQLLRC